MNAPLDVKMDKATFFRWASHQEGKYELVGGRPVLQESATRRHGQIAKNIEHTLDHQLDAAQWSVMRGELSVEVGDETRIPDVMVEPAGLDGKAVVTSVPVLLVEVLSPSSLRNDMKAKPDLYFRLESLEAYVVVNQDQRYAWVWQRSQDAARAFPEKPDEIDDPAASIKLTHLGVELPLTEIYRGIFRG